MNPLKHLTVILLIIAGPDLAAQAKHNSDTTIVFKVYGVCEQCKDRIEEAARGRGVRSASWNLETQQLSLVYDTRGTTPGKVQKRIVAAGHDLETEKANDRVYNGLPACCHYREIESIKQAIKTDTNALARKLDEVAERAAGDSPAAATMHYIDGVVLESNNKGQFVPLAGASVVWLGSNAGTLTDSTGVFHILFDGRWSRLIVSYSGYRSDTLAVTDRKELKIILAANRQLAEVVVTSKLRSTYLSALNPVRTQVMTERELFKAACCNLSESFETNPSVDVSYNDAVTGSKQIQLLGLNGNYTQLTVENLPGPRGIATPLGLNSVAGPWIESIQLTKGIGSVANGYESIAGQINVELKKPESSESLYANAYVNDFGKTDLNLNLAKKPGKKWSTALLLHDDFLTNRNIDFNRDGFRDLPTGNQFSAINRWKYDDGKGLLTQFGIKILTDKRTGGEVDYDPDTDKNTTTRYGVGINTNRYEVFAKIGYVFPGQKYKSIGLQLSGISHRQNSYFGLTVYNGKQQNAYGNLIYQSIIGNTNHRFRTGLSFLYDNYNEDYQHLNYQRKEIIPGAFFEYTYTYLEKFSAVLGIRTDHHNLFGTFVTPRLHLRYEPAKGTIIRLSAGRGQRTASIFAENTSVFVSARQVNILSSAAGKAYGLNPEIAWNKGVSIDQSLKLFHRDAMISIDFFRNDFQDQVVVDLEDARQIKFYNLQGKSYSNSFQAEFNFQPVKKLDIRLAYRYFDVKTSYEGRLLERPLISRDRVFANIAYNFSGWKLDYTINYNGRKRIPGTRTNPFPYQRKEYSPAFVTMNAQVSKSIGKKHPVDLYIGAENLGNYFQKDVIVAAGQPFSQYFDASLVWAPVTGRMFYAGWRFKIK
jgi:outer membrane receptor for ferrienterochelin and colicins